MAFPSFLPRLSFLFCLGIMTIGPLFCLAGTAGGETADDLTVELARNPLGLDVRTPRFSWKMKPEENARGQFQTGWRVLVATRPDLLREGSADVWDSGQQDGSSSVLVRAPGLSLEPRTRYYWSVKLWDAEGRSGDYASPASFETGIFDSVDWFADGAKWIESPLGTVNGADVDYWARHVLLRLRQSPLYNATATPSEADYREARTRYGKHLREDVGPGSLMRREFDAAHVVKARLFITGLGYYRAYLNGMKIGHRDLAPSDSHFFANVYYQVYDVTGLLHPGRNCLAVELVNGRWRAWFGKTPEAYSDRPILIARLEMEDTAGNRRVVVTDEHWQCGQSPLRKSGFWIGELCDARMDQPGWKNPGFDAPGWVPARAAKVGRKLREFTLDPMPPEKMSAPLPPVGETEPKPGVYVFDFGRIVAGRARFTFHGLKAGQRVVVRYSEAIDERPLDARYALAYYDSFDNTRQGKGMLKFISRSSCGSDGFIFITGPDGKTEKAKLAGATAYTDMFISAGKPEEQWTPNFTYTGFHYLEVLGLDSRRQLAGISAYDLRTEPRITGSLTTSSPKLNEVIKGVQSTLRANFHSQFQDNLGAERNPNALNVALNDFNAAYWMDVYPLWRKVALDTVDADTSFDWPVNMVAGLRGASAKKNRDINISNSLHYGHLPFDLLSFFNERELAGEMLGWTLRFVKETSEFTVWNSTAGSSDHIAETSLKDLPAEKLMRGDRLTSPQFVKCGFIIRVAKLGIAVADQLGRVDAARQLREELAVFEKRVAATYRDPTTGQWTPGYPLLQGRNTALMYFMMQPRGEDRALCRQIVDEIHTRTNGHQVTGSRLSYPLIHELSQNGFEEEALRLLEREKYPSLLNMIRETGGTVRESWGTLHSFAQIEGLSAMSNWFYTDLVGIHPEVAHPAFARFSLIPHVPRALGDVNFAWESPRGPIRSHWQKRGNGVEWEITVPPNATAQISIPASTVAGIKESGAPVSERPGVKFLRQDRGRQVFETVSGHYRFEFRRGPKPE